MLGPDREFTIVPRLADAAQGWDEHAADEIDHRQPLVDEFADALREVDACQTLGHFDMTPGRERLKHHEQVGDAATSILEIKPSRLSWFHRNRLTRFGNQLLRRFVKTNDRSRFARPTFIDLKYVLHCRDELGAGLRRDHP